jgi:predicted metal-binding protein
MEKYLNMLLQNGANKAIIIDTKSIVTAAWAFYKCKFGCDTFGKNHCCPPNAPTWKETQEMIDCFHTAILFRSNDLSIVTPLAVKAAREMFLDDYYKVIAFGSGPCENCSVCNPSYCNFPKKTVPAMEACGIDVFATVRNNGFEIHTLRTKEDIPSYYGLLLIE